MSHCDLWTALNHVHRWHTNPALAPKLQTNAQHSGSMAALALDIWPDCSRDLLKACILHDAPEVITGDMPWGCKVRSPEIKGAMDRAEEAAAMDNGWTFWTDETDTARLKFLDRLEAYRFAQQYAPNLLEHEDWQHAFVWLEREAERLGVFAEVAPMIGWFE